MIRPTNDATTFSSNSITPLAGKLDGVVDGWALTDSQGAFTFTPSGLVNGSAMTIRARVRQWDYQAGTYAEAEWAESGDPGYLTFTPHRHNPHRRRRKSRRHPQRRETGPRRGAKGD